MDKYVNLTNVLFIILTCIILYLVAALFLCFFSLLASMITNIVEQCKELAILRSIGLSNYRLIRMYKIIINRYLWESLSTVLTSSVLGVSIGIFIGYSFCFQMSLFTDTDGTITIPYIVFLYI